MWLVDTFDDLAQYLPMFEDAEIIGSFEELTFKKKTETLSIYYGLFDEGQLIAYYWIVKFPSQHNMWLGFELRVDLAYQRRGIAMFFYEQIVLVDEKTLVSDFSHNKLSSSIWDKLSKIQGMKVGSYNRITDKIEWGSLNKEKVYGNGHMHFVVTTK